VTRSGWQLSGLWEIRDVLVCNLLGFTDPRWSLDIFGASLRALVGRAVPCTPSRGGTNKLNTCERYRPFRDSDGAHGVTRPTAPALRANALLVPP